jgi:hypothetical protein
VLQSNVSAGETHTAVPDGLRAKKANSGRV